MLGNGQGRHRPTEGHVVCYQRHQSCLRQGSSLGHLTFRLLGKPGDVMIGKFLEDYCHLALDVCGVRSVWATRGMRCQCGEGNGTPVEVVSSRTFGKGSNIGSCSNVAKQEWQEQKKKLLK